jgi:hypothetical protein
MKQTKNYHLIQVYPVDATPGRDYFLTNISFDDGLPISFDLTDDYFEGWQLLSLRQFEAVRAHLRDSQAYSPAYCFLVLDDFDQDQPLKPVIRYERTTIMDRKPLPVTVVLNLDGSISSNLQ